MAALHGCGFFYFNQERPTAATLMTQITSQAQYRAEVACVWVRVRMMCEVKMRATARKQPPVSSSFNGNDK